MSSSNAPSIVLNLIFLTYTWRVPLQFNNLVVFIIRKTIRKYPTNYQNICEINFFIFNSNPHPTRKVVGMINLHFKKD